MSRGRPLAACAALGALLAGCTLKDPVALRSCNGCAQDRATYCAGAGPPPLPAKRDGPLGCGGAVAAQLFSRALCVCGGHGGSHALSTDSYDSLAGPYAPGGTRGSVGSNGKIDTAAALSVGGALEVSSSEGIQAATQLIVTGDLRDAGPLGGEAASARIGGDAAVGRDVRLAGLRVGGTLTVPAAAAVVVSGAQEVGAVRRAEVNVAAPCPCGAAAPLDVAAFVAARRQSNDDDTIGLSPDALGAIDQDTTLELPCGQFFQERVEGQRALTLRVLGRAALYVARGITMSGPLRVLLAEGAELDLFIDGSVNLSAPPTLGDPAAPARLRIYAGAAGSIGLSAGGLLAGNLYAPEADLALQAGPEVFGALLVGRVLLGQDLTIHYDTSVGLLAGSCP